MLGSAVKMLRRSVRGRGAIAGATALMASIGAVTYVSSDGVPVEDIAPQASLGAVDNPESSCLFVPGSICNAVESGREFQKSWASKTGEVPAIINSQMWISEYPGQIFGTESASKRNKAVESGIKKYLVDSKHEEVEVIAHSAGAKTAMRAVKEFFQETRSSKRVKLFLIGGGSPELGMEKELAELLSSGAVEVCNIIHSDDLVPATVGASSNVVYVTDKESEIRNQKLEEYIESFSHPEEDREYSEKSYSFIKALEDVVASHFIDSYIPSLHAEVIKSRAKSATRSVSKVDSSTLHQGAITPVSKKGRGI